MSAINGAEAATAAAEAEAAVIEAGGTAADAAAAAKAASMASLQEAASGWWKAWDVVAKFAVGEAIRYTQSNGDGYQFDFGGLMASMAMAYMPSAIPTNANGNVSVAGFAGDVLRNSVKNVIAEEIRSVTWKVTDADGNVKRYEPDWGKVAVDSIANAAGTALGGAINDSIAVSRENQRREVVKSSQEYYTAADDGFFTPEDYVTPAEKMAVENQNRNRARVVGLPDESELQQRALWDYYSDLGLPNIEDPRVRDLMGEIDNRQSYRDWLGDYDRNTLPEAFGGPSETGYNDPSQSIPLVPGGITPEQARAAMPYALTSSDSYSSQTPSTPDEWMLRLNLEAQGIHRLNDAQLLGANRDAEMERALRGFTIDPTRLEYDPKSKNAPLGYAGAMYYDSNTGKVIFANRGTNFTSGVDWKNNGENAFGFEAAQFDHAVRLGVDIQRVLGDTVVFAGHSLGGGLASAQSLATGAQAVTFNSSGVSSGTISRLQLDREFAPRVTGYYIDGEVLSRVQDSFVLDAVAAYYITPYNNVFAAVGVVGDLLNGRSTNFSSFGVAAVPEAIGTRYPIPAVDLAGRPMSYLDTWRNTIDLHGMEYVVQSLRSVYSPR